jgi:uncharacterized protein YkwD
MLDAMRYLSILLVVIALFLSGSTRVDAVGNGSLVKSSISSSVYYLVDGGRYAFPNEKVFFSWYGDFSSVVTISGSELASYPLTGNVTYRPGLWLIKIQTDPRVYAVSRYGILRWVATEQVASALYGAKWSTKVHDIPDAFFINYKIGTPIGSAQDYSPQTELTIARISQNILGATDTVVVNLLEAMERKTFDLINQHRQSKGIAVLVWNETIANAARGHSDDMAAGEVVFGHEGFFDRINGLRSTMNILGAAENVASNNGFPDPATTAVQGWLKSPGHLTNIENATYNQTGVGIAQNGDGSYYFTQDFAEIAPAP